MTEAVTPGSTRVHDPHATRSLVRSDGVRRYWKGTPLKAIALGQADRSEASAFARPRPGRARGDHDVLAVDRVQVGRVDDDSTEHAVRDVHDIGASSNGEPDARVFATNVLRLCLPDRAHDVVGSDESWAEVQR